MNTTKVPYNIINGPNKSQLVESFLRAYSPTKTIVLFVLEDGTKMEGRIISLEYEDGSGKNFNFKGYFRIYDREILFVGCYNSHKRTGIITEYAR